MPSMVFQWSSMVFLVKFCFPSGRMQSAVEVCTEALGYCRHAHFYNSRLFGRDISFKDENIWTYVICHNYQILTCVDFLCVACAFFLAKVLLLRRNQKKYEWHLLKMNKKATLSLSVVFICFVFIQDHHLISLRLICS